jgi:hypothetical protein
MMTTPRDLTRGVIAAAAAVWLTSACAPRPATQETEVVSLAVKVRFTAMWWSDAQMERLNPNNPPPKDTEVELNHWEYTDPIGVPHPDAVYAVVTVENHGKHSVGNLVVITEGEWKVGALENASSAEWQAAVVLGKSEERFEVQPGSQHTTRLPVNLKQMMDALEREHRWPYVLRVTARVDQAAGQQSLARTQVDFPIRPGN